MTSSLLSLPLMSTLQQRSQWLAACLAIAVACIATASTLSYRPSVTASSSAQQSAAAHSNFSYVVLIDGGSSGTRVHVHPYLLPSAAEAESAAFTPLPTISPSISLKVKPGLSAFPSPSEAAASLLPLLAFARQHVPAHLQSSTPLYLYATGGLRTIPLPDAESILAECRAVLSASPFLSLPSWTRIISGVSEGINGWIAANYLLQNFNSATASPQTIGVLEMGGASLQLTYAPLQPALFSPSALVPLQLARHSFNVYTVSYLNYGLEKAQELYASRHHDLLQHRDPCYPAGLTSKTGRAVRGDYSHCVQLVDQLIVHEIQEDKQQTAESDRQHGRQPSLDQIMDQQDAATAASASSLDAGSLPDAHSPPAAAAAANCSVNSPCSFSGHAIPPISPSERFLAIENFYYTSEFFSLLPHETSASQGWDMQQLKEKGDVYCSLTWEEIVRRWPHEPLQDLEKYCFSAAYLPRVLEVGLRMGGQERGVEGEAEGSGAAGRSSLLHNVQIRKEINGVAIDWALGAVLLEITNHLHAELYEKNGKQASHV